MAKLVASSKNYAWRHPAVYQPSHVDAAERFLLAVYENAKKITATKRLEFKRNRYFYTPTDEGNTLIRVKNM